MENTVIICTGMKKQKYYVEGPDWKIKVQVNTLKHVDVASRLFEAGSSAIKNQLENCDLNLGAVVLIRPDTPDGEEFIVNSFICLLRAGEDKLAMKLRKKFKASTGLDLAVDDIGYLKSVR
jgi:hypothetical protein